MKVTILGASSVVPNPGGACTGLLVESGDTRLLIDCGPGVVSQLHTVMDSSCLSAVVISHMHADHCLDLVTLRYALKYGPWQGDKTVKPLYLPPGGAAVLNPVGEKFDEEGSDFFDETFAVHSYEPTKPLSIGPLRLTFTPTRHYIPCWAIRIEAEGRVFAFSADTGPDVDLNPVARDADLFLCESGVFSRRADPATWGHLAPDEAGAIARQAGVNRLAITHIWHGYDRAAMVQAAAEAFGGPTTLATERQVYVV